MRIEIVLLKEWELNCAVAREGEVERELEWRSTLGWLEKPPWVEM